MSRKFHKLHKFNEHLYNFIINMTYLLYFLIALGLSAKAPGYLDTLNFYTEIYISIFLMLRFNPFVNVKFTRLDKKIIFSASVFLLFSTIPIYKILKSIFNF